MKKLLTLLSFCMLASFGAQAQCQANFSAMDSAGYVFFNNLSVGPPNLNYIWYFGNGNTSSAENPVEQYANGLYSVCLTIYDSAGCQDTYCDSIYVSSNPGGGGNCSVSIVDSSGLLFAFPTGVAPYTYAWDNGATTSYIQPNANGVYCVIITDANGCYATACYTYQSGGGTGLNCSVTFSSWEDSLNVGTLYFYATATNGTAPYSYTWYFSDGGTATGQYPTYSFTQGTGWDWACVEITDANGCYSSYCDYVWITPNNSFCYADFSAWWDDINGNTGEVFFNDWSSSNGNIVSWSWDLGDGTTSTVQNPVHTYTVAGYYTICLTIVDANGCTDSYCQTCYIDPSWWNASTNPWSPNTGNCVADFIALQDSTLPGMIYLVNLSFGTGSLDYYWDFGNGTTANTALPFTTFNSFGCFNVCLTVTDSLNNCYDTYCDSICVDSLGNLLKAENWGISVIPTPMPQSITSVMESEGGSPQMAIYPNPVTDQLNLQLGQAGDASVTITITNVVGQIVSSEVHTNLGLVQINTSHLTKGAYVLSVESQNGKTYQSMKFMK